MVILAVHGLLTPIVTSGLVPEMGFFFKKHSQNFIDSDFHSWKPLKTSLNGTKCSIDEKKEGNFDHFWSNLTTFDPRRDFRFGPGGENIAKSP